MGIVPEDFFWKALPSPDGKDARSFVKWLEKRWRSSKRHQTNLLDAPKAALVLLQAS